MNSKFSLTLLPALLGSKYAIQARVVLGVFLTCSLIGKKLYFVIRVIPVREMAGREGKFLAEIIHDGLISQLHFLCGVVPFAVHKFDWLLSEHSVQ